FVCEPRHLSQVAPELDRRSALAPRDGGHRCRDHRSPPPTPPVGRPSVSLGAHQFEIYAVQAHLPRKMKGKVSYFGIFFGDFTPDFLSKFWVYGITINGHHYGSSVPPKWPRGVPGMGMTHQLF